MFRGIFVVPIAIADLERGFLSNNANESHLYIKFKSYTAGIGTKPDTYPKNLQVLIFQNRVESAEQSTTEQQSHPNSSSSHPVPNHRDICR
jgi:hypothetical protein